MIPVANGCGLRKYTENIIIIIIIGTSFRQLTNRDGGGDDKWTISRTKRRIINVHD